ncbi:MAG: heparinase II/III family protein, partial [Candidatus Glassbacteria bacterium]
GDTTDAGLELMWDAFAFDWLYNHPNFSEEEKRQVIENLVRGAQSCIQMYDGQGAHIFHTRMYGYPTGAGIAGLALAGHHPEAQKFMDWAYGKYMNDLFPAREVQDGSVHNSLAYGRKYTMWLVGHFIAGWSSATGENLWQIIREEQGDWAWREALFLICAEQPDGRLVRYGDNFFRGTERFSFEVVSERAFYYAEPAGQGYLNYLIDRHKTGTDHRIGMEMGNAYEVFLYWDADDPGVPRSILPPRTLFSPHGTGMAFWRTGWDPDDTFIFFKCGDYFDNHGHFDAGHVEVFRRAPLLIEGGSYAGGTESQHYIKYFHNSVAHNTIQIVDPADPEDAGSQRFYNNQGMNTIGHYRRDVNREYGNVIDYRDCGDSLTYLAAEFSAAYPAGRAERVVRELVWTAGRFLVVVDNIRLADPKYQPRILWHYTVKPQAEKQRFTVSAGGARAVVSVAAPAEARIEQVESFRVGTGVYPPTSTDPSLGVGRAETSVAGAGRTGYTFVHVVDVADDGTAPAAIDAASASDQLVKVSLGTVTLVMEGKPGARSRITVGKP